MSQNGKATEDLLASAAEKAIELHGIVDALGDRSLVEMVQQLLFDIALRLAKQERSRDRSTPSA